VALAVDYNQSQSVPEAQRPCRALEPLDLAWIEEPTRADDDDGHARIAREVITPIMIGENWGGPREMARSIAAGACDLAMPDVMKIGGVSGWIRAAGLAAVAGMPMSSHLFPEVSVHLLAVTPTADRLEVLDLAAPVLRTPLRVEAGMVTPSAEPGSGLDWDEDAVKRYRL
jgi:mandelate racemase